ncbi:MAG TPA: alpha/beta hydrolase [Pirellulales bacterium]|nr:alpha/beta hydrolase [Pirellulales bacterium]
MPRRFPLALVIVLCSMPCCNLSAAERPDKLTLWPDGKTPGALGNDAKDAPTLTAYWPASDKATGAAIVVCPGGGYRMLAPHEGEAYARWLNDLGIAAFVLKYRLVSGGYHVPDSLQDAARAIRTVRANAAPWQLDPKRIGIMGSSAGGHLSATLSTRFDAGRSDSDDPIEQAGSRPDACILCYAFILMDRSDAKRQEQFLGKDPSPEQIRAFAPALNVRADTPPCFVWQTVADAGVKVENALVFAEALRQAKVPFALHLYQNGPHGIGLGVKEYDPAKLHPWTRDCAFWLGEQGFLAKK